MNKSGELPEWEKTIQEKEKASRERRKNRMRRRRNQGIARIILKLAAVSGILLLLCLFVVCPYAVHGNRMFPKLRDGDCAVVLKVGKYHQGDVVTFKKNGVRYFSRIAAMYGDHVVISKETFLINDLPPAEDVFYETRSDDDVDAAPGTKEFFLLNDYRSDQADSRKFGCIKKSDIDGKVIFLFRWRGI